MKEVVARGMETTQRWQTRGKKRKRKADEGRVRVERALREGDREREGGKNNVNTTVIPGQSNYQRHNIYVIHKSD